MKNKKQKTMLPSKIISALIAGLLGISSMATADVSDNEEPQSRVEEIVVTASKREERVEVQPIRCILSGRHDDS